MLSKSIVALVAFAVAQVAFAQPYCLLTAVNKFEHPADQKTLCCKEASKVKSYLHDLCPSTMESAAVQSFESACQDAGYGSCASSSSSNSTISQTSSTTASASSGPYPKLLTTTYYDTNCSCTKTKVASSTVSPAVKSSGLATGTATVATGSSGASVPAKSANNANPSATGSPITPVTGPTNSGSGTNPSGSSSGSTSLTTKNFVSIAVGLLTVAGLAWAL